MTTNTLSVAEAADMLKVHANTILQMIQRGELRAAKIGRAYVMLTNDVLDYAERLIVKQTAERMGKSRRAANGN